MASYSRWIRPVVGLLLAATVALLTLSITPVSAAAGPQLVMGVATGVDDNWQTVTLGDTYTDMVVVASPEYPIATMPLVTRIRNVTETSFDLRVQNPVGGDLVGEPDAGRLREGGSADFSLVHGDPFSDASALWREWRHG